MFGVNLGSGTMGTIKNLSAYTTTNTAIRGNAVLRATVVCFMWIPWIVTDTTTTRYTSTYQRIRKRKHIPCVDACFIISQTIEHDKNRLYVLYYTKIVIPQNNIFSHGKSTSTLDLKLLHKGTKILAYGMCKFARHRHNYIRSLRSMGLEPVRKMLRSSG
ncbi:hypothetical protein V1478_016638 [Vespula squamosa]|uniref:Uncharacterized protein n=1 Tax=Vespula squamosa TaxID=30214 RepID=A0ABD2A0Z3_VESSQ